MKIDLSSIIRDHLKTLHVHGSERVSIGDLCLFYGVPIFAAGISTFCDFEARADVYNASITFFGIFIALLLNIQVGIFSIFQRKWDLSDDRRVRSMQDDTLKIRRALLIELNANISYLVMVCFVALLAFFVFYAQKIEHGFAPAVMVFLYIHFLFTLLMIVKRSHALFQKEYRDSPE